MYKRQAQERGAIEALIRQAGEQHAALESLARQAADFNVQGEACLLYTSLERPVREKRERYESLSTRALAALSARLREEGIHQ